MGDGLGTGKTRAIVEYIRAHEPQRVLILCPATVVGVWPQEFERVGYTGKYHIIAHSGGTVATRACAVRDAMAGDKPYVVVCNYEAAWRAQMIDQLMKRTWDLVVLDESHRVKTPGSRIGRAIHRLKGIRRVCLTGTPMPHSRLDIFNQYKFLDPTIYGTSYTRFKAKYCEMGGYHVAGRPVQIVGWRQDEDFKKRYHTLAHRVRKDDVLDLPDIIHTEIPVEMPTRTRRIYRDLQQHLIAEVQGGVVTAANAAVKVTRLQQLTSGFYKNEDGGEINVDKAKLTALQEILEDADPERPIIVFCRFHHDLDSVKEAAQNADRPHSELSGRWKDFTHLWKPQRGEVAAVQIQAGGVGIDLTAASTCVYYSQTFNLGDYEQSLSRVHRPGQKHRVQYIHLLTKNSVDRTIHRALRERKDAIAAVVDAMKGGTVYVTA